MEWLKKIIQYYLENHRKLSRWKKVVSIMAALVVFVTTYALILPAITVDKESSTPDKGIYLEGSEGETYEQEEDDEWQTEYTQDSEEDSDTQDSDSQDADKDEGKKETQTDGDNETKTEDQSVSSESTEQKLEASNDYYTVTMLYDDSNLLPEDSTLEVTELEKGTKDYRKYLKKVKKTLLSDKENKKISDIDVRFFDLSILNGKEKIQPYGKVELEILTAPVKVEKPKKIKAVHFWAEDEDLYEPEILKTKAAETKNGVESVHFTVEEASMYAVVYSVDYEDKAEVTTEAEKVESAEKTTEAESAEATTTENKQQEESAVADTEEKDDSSEVNTENTKPTEVTETEVKGDKSALEEKPQAGTLEVADEDYRVSLSYGEGAKIPENAELDVKEIEKGSKDYESYLNKAKKALEDGEDHRSIKNLEVRFFDITIQDGKKEIQPDEKVNVEIKADPVKVENPDQVKAVHFDGNETELIETNTEGTKKGVETVQFEAEGFSVYGIVYTVDFEYEDPETHEVYKYSIEGGSSIKLSTLAEILGIAEKGKGTEFIREVEDVTFSEPTLIKVTKDDNDWTLKSLKAFTSEETLTVEMADGEIIVIKVTDDKIITINFFESDGTTNTTVDLDGYNYLGAADGYPGNITWCQFNITDSSAVATVPDQFTGLRLSKTEEGDWWNLPELKDHFTLGEFDVTKQADGSYKAVKMPSYAVEIVFVGGTASGLGSDYSVYAAVQEKNQSGKRVTYFNKKDSISLDGIESKTISFTSFSRSNDTPNSISYSLDTDVSVVLGKNIEIEQNGDNRGTIKGGVILKDGDVLDGFVVNITSSDDKTTYTFSKPDPYTYSVKAMNGNSEENINFTEGPWYLYGEVTRLDGTYFYVRKIQDGGQITGTVDKLKRYEGVNNSKGETVPANNDHISFALLRPKDSGQSDQPGYFYTADNMNVKALSGSSVDSMYTLEVVPGDSHSDIILRKGPQASIELTSYDENKTPENVPSLNASGSYFIVGELSFRDGLEDKTCYYVEKLNGNQSQKIVIPNFTGKNNDIQYLTGTRSFEPVLVHDTNEASTPQQVLNKLINNDSSISIYRDGDPVESYRLTSVNGTLDNPEGTIELHKLPTLNAAGEIQDKNGNPTTKKDAETYNLLVEITRDGKKAYAYQPLTFGSDGKMAPVKITDVFKEETSGETWYYSEEDSPKFYVVKGNFANHDAAVASADRFATDQLMGTYTPSFTFDEETYTVTTVLKETETHAGTPYNVRIDMMNKEQTDIEQVDPQLSGNYYVLATLTPKGTGSKGQVVAWDVINVDLSDLNPDGTWSGTIPADGFNVCNANMDSTGTKIGYNADEYDINLRLYHSDTAYTNYNDIRKNADDSAPSGYDFKGVYTKENDPITGTRHLNDDNTSVIRLHKAYDKVYGIRAYVDNPGLDILEGEYVVKVKLSHVTGDDTYAFAKLKIDPSVGGDTPAVLEFYSGDQGRIWRDQNGNLQSGSNYTFTGNEKGVELTLMSLTNGGESFAEWVKEPSQTNTYTLVKPGESIKLYTFTYGDREEEENISQQKNYVYDVIRFTKDVNGISKGKLDEKLKQARDFGLYTELLSKHATDMESNIGAAVLSGEIGADYGFSGNNIKVNRITVTKQYYENGNPVNKQVTLRLYPVETYDEATGQYTLGAMISEKQGNTNSDGLLKLEFDRLEAGKYVLKEVINGKEYDFSYNGSTDGHIVDGNTVIQFQDKFIDIENINVNYNYFGDITDNVSLTPVLTHSRHGLIVVGNDQDYNALINANGGEVSSEGTTVKRAGADPDYPVLDIPSDMQNLRELSNLLGVSANSQTVRIINTTLEEINQNNGLKLKSDGRYIVVNIDMTDAPSVATVNLDTYIDNQRLLADFGANGNEDSSKVLYNFITKDSHGHISNYTGKINTATQAAGVILAPSAIVADLGGNFGGTIICKEAQHTGSEIHSDSANKIQNKNTMLTNGVSNKGNLELIKSFTGEIDDRTTWFTFKVTAHNADGTLLTGEYSATGLREGDKVTFDQNGEATVLVRAQNKVFIVGLPEGVTYSVTEVDTPETELYSYDHTTPENGAGTIEANKTSSVEVVNTQNKVTCDLVIIKTVEGPITEQDAKNLQFVVQVLDTEGNVTGYLDKDGNVSETEVILKLSDGFTINKDSNGYIMTAAKRFSGINAGRYKVVESNLEIAGYNFVSEQSVTSAETIIEAGKTGSLDIKDVYSKPFEFTKIWKTADDQIEEWPNGKKITVTLYSLTEGDSEAVVVDTFELTASGGTGAATTYSFAGTKNADKTYTFRIDGLPSKVDGKKVTYYVKETKVDGYQDPVYAYKDSSGVIQRKTGDNAEYAADEEYIINRPEDSYELPSTGGSGTRLFTILGSALILVAGVLLLRRRRMLEGGGGLL